MSFYIFGLLLALFTLRKKRVKMTIAYIQKKEFSYAEDLIKVLNSRVINVSAIEDTFKNDSPIITTSNNTYICTSSWENKLGGQQGLLEFARKVKSKTIIVVHEKCNEFKIEKHLGGNLIRFYFKEEPYEIKINENFQLQLLLSLIQPKDSMTAGDTNSHQLLKLSKKVSEADVTVFINGPTGTGKEVLSRFIHKNSRRSEKPFVGINCAAIPENMLEAILFGHEKGAFTGASTSNKGIFRAADTGTLLLDEISEMPLSLQAKLLRVLQEKIVTPLGSQQEIPVDVRVIATTNRSMMEEIKQNKFREDLYYRLNVFPLLTKSLAERKDDIIPIATNLLTRHIKELSEIPYIEHNAIKALLDYNWPGNVRELENVIQRALVLCSNNKISELDIIVDTDNSKASVQDNLRDQILSKASLEEGISNV